MAGLRRFLGRRLRLEVNEEKSAVDLASQRGFLGFSFLRGKAVRVRLDPDSLRRVRSVIRRHTKRQRSIAIAERIQRLNAYLVGWVQYCASRGARAGRTEGGETDNSDGAARKLVTTSGFIERMALLLSKRHGRRGRGHGMKYIVMSGNRLGLVRMVGSVLFGVAKTVGEGRRRAG